MLASHTTALAAFRLVLASGSPRRADIFQEQMGLNVEVRPSRFAEDLDKSAYATPHDYCLATSRGKALEVASRCCGAGEAGGRAQLVVSADTIVSVDGRVLEKPRDEAHAREMISSLSEREHEVITAVTLLLVPRPGEAPSEQRCFAETTRVRFSRITAADVAAYVATGEPMDKAGGYGIQGKGGAFVQSIHGCYYNVVGFPLNRFCREVADLLGLEKA